jgi:hypothetical protein
VTRRRIYSVAMVFFVKYTVGGSRIQVGGGAAGQGKSGDCARLRFEHDIDAGEMVVCVEIPVYTAHYKPGYLGFFDGVR